MLNLLREKKLFSSGFKVIAGIDEAGCGPLAGPVVAACVLISPDFKLKKKLKEVKNSKELIAAKREELYDYIMDNFLEVSVGICDNFEIDKLNILHASHLAMIKAVANLKNKPDFILVDGRFNVPQMACGQEHIIKGDVKIFCIAAASIIAKVTRDRIMVEEHKKYPQYEFNKHKGYCTKLHLEKLKQYGPCPIHRRSFEPVQKYKNNANLVD